MGRMDGWAKVSQACRVPKQPFISWLICVLLQGQNSALFYFLDLGVKLQNKGGGGRGGKPPLPPPPLKSSCPPQGDGAA